MTVLACLLAALAACVVTSRPLPPGAGRSHPPPPRPDVPPRAARTRPPAHGSVATGAAGSAGLAVALLAGLPSGPPVGLMVAVCLTIALRRLETGESRRRSAAVLSELPLTLDLLAACLASGGSLERSVRAVGTATGGPLGAALLDVAAASRLGAAPADAWQRLSPPGAAAELAIVTRTVARAAAGGTALATTLSRVSGELRETARLDGEAAARRAGVWAVAPLALCFLPAFVVLTVVPMVLSLVGQVLV